MAHLRQRHCQELFDKLKGFGPVLGLFGHRQVGKTTFGAAESGAYSTLDDEGALASVRADPKAFVRSAARRSRSTGKPSVIDECQIEPRLFPAIKDQIRQDKRPGQLLLTGSVRFTSRRAIRESLAGRISTIEMLPLTIAELDRRELPSTLPDLLKARRFEQPLIHELRSGSELALAQKRFDQYLRTGGLPGLCFLREERLRQEALLDLHRLILDRDLRMVVETRLSLETLMRFLRVIAASAWEGFHPTTAKAQAGISVPTQKAILFALESIYLVRRIPIRGRAGEIILMEDQYEELTLSKGSHSRAWQAASALYRNIRAQFSYRLGLPAELESYWTRSGARVPVVVRGAESAIGIIPFEGERPSLAQRRAGDSFLRNEGGGKVVFASTGIVRATAVSDRILVCSAANLV